MTTQKIDCENIQEKFDSLTDLTLEHSYRLGVAIHIIQCLLGEDEMSKESVEGAKWIKKHAKKNAREFLALEDMISAYIPRSL